MEKFNKKRTVKNSKWILERINNFKHLETLAKKA